MAFGVAPGAFNIYFGIYVREKPYFRALNPVFTENEIDYKITC